MFTAYDATNDKDATSRWTMSSTIVFVLTAAFSVGLSQFAGPGTSAGLAVVSIETSALDELIPEPLASLPVLLAPPAPIPLVEEVTVDAAEAPNDEMATEGSELTELPDGPETVVESQVQEEPTEPPPEEEPKATIGGTKFFAASISRSLSPGVGILGNLDRATERRKKAASAAAPKDLRLISQHIPAYPEHLAEKKKDILLCTLKITVNREGLPAEISPDDCESALFKHTKPTVETWRWTTTPDSAEAPAPFLFTVRYLPDAMR